MQSLAAMTLEEITAHFGCTPQAIRHTEKNALRKLRAQFVARKIVTEEGRYSNG